MKKEKGAAIITILMVLVIISILGFVFLETGAGDYIYANINKNNISAYYLAWAGVEYASGKSFEYSNHTETIKLTTGSCLIEASTAGLGAGQVKVICTGIPNNSKVRKKIEAVIKNGEISNWKQR